MKLNAEPGDAPTPRAPSIVRRSRANRHPIIDVWLATTRHDLEYSDKEPDTLEKGWTTKETFDDHWKIVVEKQKW